MDDEILPCPFCGYENVEEVMNDSLRSLECLNCHATGPWVEDVIEDPAEAWNSRDSDSPFVVEEADYG